MNPARIWSQQRVSRPILSLKSFYRLAPILQRPMKIVCFNLILFNKTNFHKIKIMSFSIILENTPLNILLANGLDKYALVKLLLDWGAPLHSRNVNNNETCFEIIQKKSNLMKSIRIGRCKN